VAVCGDHDDRRVRFADRARIAAEAGGVRRLEARADLSTRACRRDQKRFTRALPHLDI
jgi:hypothetical protein